MNCWCRRAPPSSKQTLAALEQLEPANVPMPFVPQVRRTPRRLLKIVIIAAVCAVLATTAYAFWPRVAVILEGSRAYLAVQEAPQNSIPMEQMQLTWLPEWLHRDMG